MSYNILFSEVKRERDFPCKFHKIYFESNTKVFYYGGTHILNNYALLMCAVNILLVLGKNILILSNIVNRYLCLLIVHLSVRVLVLEIIYEFLIN